jgi:hypothetical protein
MAIISFPRTRENCTSCSSWVTLYCTFLFRFPEIREVQHLTTTQGKDTMRVQTDAVLHGFQGNEIKKYSIV